MNIRKDGFARSGSLHATLFALLALASISATAQPIPKVEIVNPLPLPVAVDVASPIQVSSNSEPGRQPYVASMGFSQFGCFTTECSNFTKSGAAILFDGPVVPEGKRLIIQYVSGRLPNEDGVDISVALQSQQVLSQFSVIWGFYGPFFGQSATRGFSSGAFATYGPGDRPHVHVILPTPNNFVGQVNISGYLIDAE